MHNLTVNQFSNRISWYKNHLAKVHVPKEFVLYHGKIFHLSALFLNHLDTVIHQDHAYKVMLNIIDDIIFEYIEKYDASLNSSDDNLISQHNLSPKKRTKKQKSRDESEKEKLSQLNKSIDNYTYNTDSEEKFEDIKEILRDFRSSGQTT
jgi:hypothetical protein